MNDHEPLDALDFLPTVVEPKTMKNSGDCGIICLEMLLGIPYATVWAACPRRGKPQHNGLSTRQMQNVARRLGVTLRYTPGNSFESPVGILDLDHEHGVGHYVILGRGTIYNPAQGEWWMDLDAYLRRGLEGKPWVVAGLLWRAT